MFITIEGIEGSGKSTLVGKMAAYLTEKGRDVISTREPGGIDIAEQIRSIILKPENTAMDGVTEALLYAAARRQHLVERVIPALREGKTVLCDRFLDSSLAYQGYARGLGVEKVFSINQPAVEQCMPDLTLYLDISPKDGLARIHADNKREVNRLDMEALSFHEKVREGYLKLLEQFPERIVRIDAAGAAEEVFAEVTRVLSLKLGQ